MPCVGIRCEVIAEEKKGGRSQNEGLEGSCTLDKGKGD